MVIVKLFGGLGNQLFQYAFGQYMAKVLNVIVKYDLQTGLSMRNFTTREFELMNFDFDINVATIDEINGLKFLSSGFFSRLQRKLIQQFPVFSKNYFVEDISHKLLTDNELKDNCYYDGYWQSFHYLDINKDVLQSQICLKKFSIGNEELVDNINLKNSISLHVRRGDYISIKKNRDIFHICNLDYYKAAIDIIEQNVSDPQYYIFSDDIEWAKQNFIGSKFIFVEGNIPHIDMYLMSNCKNNIIANSTFSWWGAWLNNNPNKVIIAPQRWYHGAMNDASKNLIPEKWIRI